VPPTSIPVIEVVLHASEAGSRVPRRPFGNTLCVRHERPGFGEEPGSLERSRTFAVPHWRRARYTPTSMTIPPTSFSIPRTSLKKMMPEATPVTVIKYW
jgi:hypothetical protein